MSVSRSSEQASDIGPLWLRVCLATVVGVFLALLVAILTRVDVQLVAAFRGSRTLPYRIAFFVALAVACAIWSRRSVARCPGLARTVIHGALIGYLAGLVAYVVVQYALISAEGAIHAMTARPAGVLVPLGVPLATFSWFLGIVAVSCARVVLRAGRPSTRSSTP